MFHCSKISRSNRWACGQSGVIAAYCRPTSAETTATSPCVGPGQRGQEPQCPRLSRIGKQRREPPPGGNAFDDFLTELLDRQHGTIGQRKGVAIMDDKQRCDGHQLAPNTAAAWCSRSVSRGGT